MRYVTSLSPFIAHLRACAAFLSSCNGASRYRTTASCTVKRGASETWVSRISCQFIRTTHAVPTIASILAIVLGQSPDSTSGPSLVISTSSSIRIPMFGISLGISHQVAMHRNIIQARRLLPFLLRTILPRRLACRRQHHAHPFQASDRYYAYTNFSNLRQDSKHIPNPVR